MPLSVQNWQVDFEFKVRLARGRSGAEEGEDDNVRPAWAGLDAFITAGELQVDSDDTGDAGHQLYPPLGPWISSPPAVENAVIAGVLAPFLLNLAEAAWTLVLTRPGRRQVQLFLRRRLCPLDHA